MKIHPLLVLTSLWLAAAGPRAHAEAPPGIIRYLGAADGSAAVALDGGRFFATAEDDLNFLRIYEVRPKDASQPRPVWEREVSGDLGVRPKDECDFEGAARIGNRIYWIGSHGFHAKPGQYRAHCILFATEVRTDAKTGLPSLELTGTPYRRLVEDLQGDPRLQPFALAEGAGQPPKTRAGLNIEALCATPEGNLLVGFRGPVSAANKALLVTLLAPAAVLEPGAKARLGEIFSLDLGQDRGFRDMAPWRGGYLIIAGHFDKKDDFALFFWSGKAGDAPRPLAADFRGLRPEGLVVPDVASDEVLLLSDDGKHQPAGAPRGFQSIRLRLVLPP